MSTKTLCKGKKIIKFCYFPRRCTYKVLFLRRFSLDNLKFYKIKIFAKTKFREINNFAFIFAFRENEKNKLSGNTNQHCEEIHIPFIVYNSLYIDIDHHKLYGTY